MPAGWKTKVIVVAWKNLLFLIYNADVTRMMIRPLPDQIPQEGCLATARLSND